MMNEKRFGIIVERKHEGPLILESRPMDEFEARDIMGRMKRLHDVIRVAVFEMRYERGNETLIPEVDSNDQ